MQYNNAYPPRGAPPALSPAQQAYDRIQRLAAAMPLIVGPRGREPDTFISAELVHEGIRLSGHQTLRGVKTSRLVTWREIALGVDDPLLTTLGIVNRELQGGDNGDR